ncbi:hypothetical protein [Vibrio sp. Hal054]|uniref:hypothetical protein n=1 Tax=Vibrio sp. Hal054 TaxID=3035158 RepID=UPI00301B9F2B
MAFEYYDECVAAGLDPKEVKRIANGLSRYAKQAEELGITVFSGTGTGSLRFNDGGNGKLIIAELDGDYDGGDGADSEDANGLRRGEW